MPHDSILLELRSRRARRARVRVIGRMPRDSFHRSSARLARARALARPQPARCARLARAGVL
jgi:hypothetical protein